MSFWSIYIHLILLWSEGFFLNLTLPGWTKLAVANLRDPLVSASTMVGFVSPCLAFEVGAKTQTQALRCGMGNILPAEPSLQHQFMFSVLKKGKLFLLRRRNTHQGMEVAQRVKALATKPGDLRSIPETHIVEERQSHQLPSDLTHMPWHECTPPHAYTRNKLTKSLKQKINTHLKNTSFHQYEKYYIYFKNSFGELNCFVLFLIQVL